MADDRCGTYAGWNRHAKAGEEPCDPCREASRQYQRDYRRRRGMAADRWRRRTREAAMLRLSREYPHRYRQILNEVRSATPAPGDGLRGREAVA